jgi:hypothetical protein
MTSLNVSVGINYRAEYSSCNVCTWSSYVHFRPHSFGPGYNLYRFSMTKTDSEYSIIFRTKSPLRVHSDFSHKIWRKKVLSHQKHVEEFSHKVYSLREGSEAGIGSVYRARICKRLWSPEIDSARLHRLAESIPGLLKVSHIRTHSMFPPFLTMNPYKKNQDPNTGGGGASPGTSC